MVSDHKLEISDQEKSKLISDLRSLIANLALFKNEHLNTFCTLSEWP
jgi:hypothetical protein